MVSFTLSFELEWPAILAGAALAFLAVRELLRDRARAAMVAVTGDWSDDSL